MGSGEFRARVCYGKEGRLRFLSHLEVMRALERGARRAGLPYAVTKGYNPHLKAAFGPALPVGTAGQHEYVDVWLTEYVPAEELVSLLSSALPEGLRPVEARYVSDRLPSLSSACTVATYELRVDGEGVEAHALAEAMDAIIAGGTLTVERKGKTKVFDLARSLPKETCVRPGEDEVIVEITVRMSQEGSLRPEALVQQALSRIDASDVAIRVARTDILTEEEGTFARPI